MFLPDDLVGRRGVGRACSPADVIWEEDVSSETSPTGGDSGLQREIYQGILKYTEIYKGILK